MSQREKVQIGSSPRDKIIERAIAVLEKDGEAGIRTNTIAADCGCTAPILYREFQSREGLIIAAQAERYKRSSQEAVVGLIRQITIATSREELYDNVSTSLDSIFQLLVLSIVVCVPMSWGQRFHGLNSVKKYCASTSSIQG